MEAFVVNNKGRTEKNKNIKAGKCIFPYKYKKHIHHTCIESSKGRICATEINPKNGILTKFGYCDRHLKKSTEKKAPGRTVKPKKKTIRVKKSAYLKPLLQAKTLAPMPPTTPPMPTPTPIVQQHRWNEEFIKILDELADIMQRQGEPFKARAYQKAQEAIIAYDKDITALTQIKELQSIGKTIYSKLEEYVTTGTLAILERERKNPINLLTRVYGIGPKKADELVKAGITTIAELRAHPELLNAVQKIGLNYFEAIETRIPRAEIDQYKRLLTDMFQNVTLGGESQMDIVGSYRRGAQTSGDIDIIITGPDSIMNLFMDRLIQSKVVIEVLSRGKTKSLTIGQLPGQTPRRIDVLYTPPSEYAFALLYFTGSKIFNTVQRHRALELGYSLNEHGLYRMNKGVKAEKIPGDFSSERAIFDKLGMVYKEPRERMDGRAVQIIQTPIQMPPAPMLAQQPIQTPPAQQPQQMPAPRKTIKIKRHTLKKKPSAAAASAAVPSVAVPSVAVPSVAAPSAAKASTDINILLANFQSRGLAFLETLTEDALSQLISAANEAYYCNHQPLMTDNEYDILREYTLDQFPTNLVAQAGHTQCAIKNKVTLPYEMWSMDKIKPDTGALAKWQQSYSGPYVFSCKLDGVSGLYSTEGTAPKLYTRGNGIVGQDISHFLPYLKLPATPNITIRGEFIIKRSVFQTKYAKDFANPRNFIAGLMNQKKPDAAKCADIHFVAYEVLKPVLKPSEQMKMLGTLLPATSSASSAFRVVHYQLGAEVSNALLSDLLIKWRAEYEYEIDGIICINDALYPRKTGNPAHAFAFKMVLSDQLAEAKVVNVIWTASKDGYLKPRVQIEPIQLGGVKIEFATGFNGKFIEENRIGVGALVRLTRSGDVIPHIIAIVQPAAQPQMPSVPYVWNATHVDVMLENKAEDATVREKNITVFFSSLEVDGLGAGNVKKIIATGYDTVPKILAMQPADFLKVPGFKDKMAQKIHASIEAQVQQASLADLMHATNIFGRGFGVKKFQSILASEPTILTDTANHRPVSEQIQRLTAVDGMAKKTAEQFVLQVPAFLAFLAEAKLMSKLASSLTQQQQQQQQPKDTSHPLYGKRYVMTGFRDKNLQEQLAAIGAEQSSAVSKNTFVLLVKDLSETNSKVASAKALNIPIMTPDEFKDKYNL